MGCSDTTSNILWGHDELMLNCLCGMVDQRKAGSFISRATIARDSHHHKSVTPQVIFKLAQNLSSGFAEESWALVMTTTTWCMNENSQQ